MRLIIIALTCLFITACATQNKAEEQSLALGKENFAVHNYDMAYEHLAPLAENGDADAQYALGYTYYNGYGVPRDEAVAVKWIKKAAKQHNLKAVRALHQLETANQSAFYVPFTS